MPVRNDRNGHLHLEHVELVQIVEEPAPPPAGYMYNKAGDGLIPIPSASPSSSLGSIGEEDDQLGSLDIAPRPKLKPAMRRMSVK